MKKFAIMFVMLLGSVATMQAQTNTTFDFSCVTVDPNDLDGDGFTNDEETLLLSYTVANDDGITSPVFADNVGQYQIETSNYDGGYIIIEPVGSQFHVYDEDEVVSEYWDTLQEAIDAALAYANA